MITGAAGFIGAALCERLLNETESYQVIGLDNLNDYYDVRLKEYRLEKLKRHDGFSFVKRDICDREALEEIFREESPDTVVHLAAQAGVRASISYPRLYIQSNIVGFFNILQACRHQKDKLEQLIFASSSSVYGDRDEEMLSTDMSTHSPSSLYAATKIADEAMGYSYSKLYGINMTGLRFFTAYGPAGRPDMAYYKFADRLCAGEKLDLYNFGKNYRDFTYVDDITDGIKRIIDAGGNKEGDVPYRIMNIGRGNTVVLDDFVRILHEPVGTNRMPAERMALRRYVIGSQFLCGSHELVVMRMSFFGFITSPVKRKRSVIEHCKPLLQPVRIGFHAFKLKKSKSSGTEQEFM